jgi:hypothetical protein
LPWALAEGIYIPCSNFWRGIPLEPAEPFHLFRYIDEQAFRFNHRKLTRPVLALALHDMLKKGPTYSALTGWELANV